MHLNVDPYKRHIMELSKEQELHAKRIIEKVHNSTDCVYKKYKYAHRSNLSGYNKKHWTKVYEDVWKSRLTGNANEIVRLRKVFDDDKSPLLYRIKWLDIQYTSLLSRLKIIEDITYSRKYILQLQLQFAFDSLEYQEDRCVKHSDITEYKDIDLEIEECFCHSIHQRPNHCLFCRHIYN